MIRLNETPMFIIRLIKNTLYIFSILRDSFGSYFKNSQGTSAGATSIRENGLFIIFKILCLKFKFLFFCISFIAYNSFGDFLIECFGQYICYSLIVLFNAIIYWEMFYCCSVMFACYFSNSFPSCFGFGSGLLAYIYQYLFLWHLLLLCMSLLYSVYRWWGWRLWFLCWIFEVMLYAV